MLPPWLRLWLCSRLHVHFQRSEARSFLCHNQIIDIFVKKRCNGIKNLEMKVTQNGHGLLTSKKWSNGLGKYGLGHFT